MSYDNERDPIEGTYRGGAGARAYGPACGAGELRGLLQRIADHIANAEERQQSTLGEMQTRLEHLVDRWPGPPKTFGAEDRGRWPDLGRDDALSRGPVSPPPSREQPFYQTRGLGEAPPPLRSAAAHSGGGGWDRRTVPPAEPGLGARYAQPRPVQPDVRGGEWDQVSAEALTRLYEPNYAAGLHGISSQPPEPESGRFGQDLRAGHDGQPAFAGTDQPDSRFAEIADRMEEALAQLDPEASTARLEARLASFEQRIGAALADLATRTDAEQLRAVEVQIDELGRHIEQAQSRLARLDDIELNLMRLVEQTSDEHVVQLIDRQVLSEPRLARLADTVAAHLAERDAFRSEVGAGMDRLRDLYGLIEQFAVAQRQGDQQTASALEVIQQAVLNLLDRMEALEGTYDQSRGAGRGSEHGQSWRTDHWDDRAASDQTHRGQDTDHYAMGVVSISSRSTEPISPGRSDVSDGPGTEPRIASSIAKAELPEQLPSAGSDSSRGQNAATDLESAEERPLLQKSREDFLAAARRAARKASSEAAGDGAVPARGAGGPRPAAGARRTTSVRPVTGLVVAMLAVVLAAGIGFTTYSIYKDGLSETWGLGRSVWELGSGAGSFGRGGAAGGADGDESSRPAETPGTGPARPASQTPPGVIIDDPAGSRPSNSGSEGARKLTGVPGGVVIDTGMIASAAARAGQSPVPAAYTPSDAEALSAESRSAASAERLMPPAAVGPLSLRLAAANGDPSAEFEVAVRLDEGRGVARDLESAAVWYRRSAARGFAPAQYRLGTLYERGLGVAADRGRAMAWYRSAAEKGNVKAMHNFAVLSADGQSADFGSAARWFGEAAEHGLVDSQFNLAVLYETGRGVEQDLKQAYKWFALAARGGDKEAERRRDRVRWMLDAGELRAAEAMVRSWKAHPMETEINDVRAAGEAWKRRDKQG